MPTIKAIKTNLPGIIVVPFPVMFNVLFADASLGFIDYGNETDELGLADADGDSDADGLYEVLGELDALPDGL